MLVGLVDLDQSVEDTRNKIVAYFNKMIDYGVAGFRVGKKQLLCLFSDRGTVKHNTNNIL